MLSCPQCKVGILKERTGPFGDFLGCSKYPDCKYVLKEKTGGYPTPQATPGAQNSPIKEVSKVNGELLIIERIDAINARLDKLIEYIVKKLG